MVVGQIQGCGFCGREDAEDAEDAEDPEEWQMKTHGRIVTAGVRGDKENGCVIIL